MMDLGEVLEASGAILRGRFVLTSGRHSDIYFEKFRVLEQPEVLTALGATIAAHFDEEAFDAVAGPTTGGIIIAFEVARQMGFPAIYVESEGGHRRLRRGKILPAGTRVLVVDDVLTTGKSLVETADVLRSAGAEIRAYAVLIDRSGAEVHLDAPTFAAYEVAGESWPADDLPPHLRDIPAVKPGTSA